MRYFGRGWQHLRYFVLQYFSKNHGVLHLLFGISEKIVGNFFLEYKPKNQQKTVFSIAVKKAICGNTEIPKYRAQYRKCPPLDPMLNDPSKKLSSQKCCPRQSSYTHRYFALPCVCSCGCLWRKFVCVCVWLFRVGDVCVCLCLCLCVSIWLSVYHGVHRMFCHPRHNIGLAILQKVKSVRLRDCTSPLALSLALSLSLSQLLAFWQNITRPICLACPTHVPQKRFLQPFSSSFCQRS